MRRRIRRLRRSRELLLRELGALVVEMHRLERQNPDLVARKAAELAAIDDELRGLRAGLGEGRTVEQVVAAGVAGSCAGCGTLVATDDRFCPNCGKSTTPDVPAAGGDSQPAGVDGAGPAEAEVASADGAAAAELADGATEPAPPPPPPPPPPAADRTPDPAVASKP
jgi:hypothetical protein